MRLAVASTSCSFAPFVVAIADATGLNPIREHEVCFVSHQCGFITLRDGC